MLYNYIDVEAVILWPLQASSLAKSQTWVHCELSIAFLILCLLTCPHQQYIEQPKALTHRRTTRSKSVTLGKGHETFKAVCGKKCTWGWNLGLSLVLQQCPPYWVCGWVSHAVDGGWCRIKKTPHLHGWDFTPLKTTYLAVEQPDWIQPFRMLGKHRAEEFRSSRMMIL